MGYIACVFGNMMANHDQKNSDIKLSYQVLKSQRDAFRHFSHIIRWNMASKHDELMIFMVILIAFWESKHRINPLFSIGLVRLIPSPWVYPTFSPWHIWTTHMQTVLRINLDAISNYIPYDSYDYLRTLDVVRNMFLRILFVFVMFGVQGSQSKIDSNFKQSDERYKNGTTKPWPWTSANCWELLLKNQKETNIEPSISPMFLTRIPASNKGEYGGIGN